MLKPDGVLVVSTPRADRGHDRPENPFHEREFAPDEFERLLARVVRSRRRLRAAPGADRTAPRAPAARRARPPPAAAVPATRVEARHGHGADGRRRVRGRRDLARRSRRGDASSSPSAAREDRPPRDRRRDRGRPARRAAARARARATAATPSRSSSPADGPFAARARAEGFAVELVDVGRTYRVDGLLRLARLLRRERADVLHTHTLAAANVLARIAGRLARVPVVSHLHIANHFRPATRAAARGPRQRHGAFRRGARRRLGGHAQGVRRTGLPAAHPRRLQRRRPSVSRRERAPRGAVDPGGCAARRRGRAALRRARASAS